MPKYKEKRMEPREEREFANLQAGQIDQNAKIDILALMTGTDFPQDDEPEMMGGMSDE